MNAQDWIDSAHTEIKPAAWESAEGTFEQHAKNHNSNVEHLVRDHTAGHPPEHAELIRAGFLWHYYERLAQLARHAAEGWCEVFYRDIEKKESSE